MGALQEASGSPVIVTRVQDPASPYPGAQVHGRLTLRNGCLIFGDGVVFWPAETGWDSERQAVTFGGDFEGAPPASINTMFKGGGGVYEASDLVGGLLSDGSLAALDDCLKKLGTDRLVLAYPAAPSWPLD